MQTRNQVIQSALNPILQKVWDSTQEFLTSNYNPDQPRETDGKFASIAGSPASKTSDGLTPEQHLEHAKFHGERAHQLMSASGGVPTFESQQHTTHAEYHRSKASKPITSRGVDDNLYRDFSKGT